MHLTSNTYKPGFRLRLGHLGAAGFTFFLAKGLLWLALPWLLAVTLP